MINIIFFVNQNSYSFFDFPNFSLFNSMFKKMHPSKKNNSLFHNLFLIIEFFFAFLILFA